MYSFWYFFQEKCNITISHFVKEKKKSDFYSFFQEAFWKPYRRGQSSPYLKNTSLVNAYLQLCPKKLAQSDQVVCQYGQLGKQLATQKNQISI